MNWEVVPRLLVHDLCALLQNRQVLLHGGIHGLFQIVAGLKAFATVKVGMNVTWRSSGKFSATAVRLELHFDSQLDGARASDLVKRREAAALSPGTKGVVQHLRGFAELSRGQIVDWGAEVRMIQNIEEIASDLKRKMFAKAKLST